MDLKFQGQCNLKGKNGKIAFGVGKFYQAILGMYNKSFIINIRTFNSRKCVCNIKSAIFLLSNVTTYIFLSQRAMFKFIV